MTIEVKINLTKAEFVKAIEEYIAKKYPTFHSESIYIDNSREDKYVYARGTIKES